MRNRRLRIFVLSLLLVLVVAVGVASADVPGQGWYFGSTYQNIGTAAATIQLTAYDSKSSATYSFSVPNVAPGASTTVLPTANFSPPIPAGFSGSIIASSDQPLAAVVNITNRPNANLGVSGGTASGLYSGVDGTQTATSVNFPLAKNQFFGKTTTFYLQNAGSNSATIQAVFKFGGNNYQYTSPSLSPGQMIAVDPGLAPGAPTGSAALGSMTATSAQPIAGVMVEHESSTAVATVLQASAGFTPAQMSNTLYCPVIKDSFFGRETGLQVQNTHTAAQNITVTFQPGGVTANANNVAPGASATFLQLANLPSGLYSARVVGSAGPIAAIVNESELPLINARQTSTTYACKSASLATNKVNYPAYKEVFFGRSTGLQVQNVGNAPATNVVVVFQVQGGGTFTTNPQTIAPGASQTFVDVRNKAIWNGAAMGAGTLSAVTVTANQPIIAIINEASWTTSGPNNGPTSFDKANAVGFNVAP